MGHKLFGRCSLWKHSTTLRGAVVEVKCAAVALEVNKHPGCPRCRLDLIRLVKSVKLPRFTLAQGERWELPQSRYTPDGAELGGGVIPKDSFEIEVEDESRACGCPCRNLLS